MKEATGEGAMTVITISLVSLALILGATIIYTLLSNQRNRTNCENNGYEYANGVCKLPNGDCKKVNADGNCDD